jgi:hypothetical protein
VSPTAPLIASLGTVVTEVRGVLSSAELLPNMTVALAGAGTDTPLAPVLPHLQAVPFSGEASPPAEGGRVVAPAAVPALAGVLTPAVAWAGSEPFRALQQLFSPARDGEGGVAGGLTRWLRWPCVAGVALALAALEVVRRRLRRAPGATELPGITGPNGL